MRKLSVILAGAIFVAAAYAQVQREQPGVFNFTLVSEQFCTGGQPRIEALEKLKAEGVKSIINLRQPSEHRAADEEARAKELGLKYYNIPVVYRDPQRGTGHRVS
jgi:NaMN:DMB phosphoribosyltransferase